ncbi:MAG: hypothetical protein ACYC1K_03315 [Minisyncoccota bacterium]
MAQLNLASLHSLGVALDPAAFELAPNAFTGASNIRFDDAEAAILKMKGYEAIYAGCPINPYWIQAVLSPTTYFWIMAGLNKVYVNDGATYTNITRQTASVDVDYAATADTRWNGGILNSIPILNNGVDDPQMWNPVDTGTKLAMLSNWPANTKCKVIRPFGYFLVALDITKGSARYPTMVKWSHSADPGTVPNSWNEADPTKDTGEVSLSQSPGFVLDCHVLRGVNVVYKEDSTYIMQYIGGSQIFSFALFLKESGILGRDCVAEFSGKHFVVSNNDVLVHDGSNVQSVVNARVRRTLFSGMDQTTAITRSFCVRNFKYNEIWFCYPEAGNSAANRALVWNIGTGAITFRELPQLTFGTNGLANITSATTWDADTATWDSDLLSWDERLYGAAEPRLLGCTAVPQILLFESTEQHAGSNMTASVERSGLDFGDRNKLKIVRELWPQMTGGAVQFYIGSQLERDDAIVWTGPFAFDPATQRKVDCLVTGRYISYRIVSTTDVSWKLQGLFFNYSLSGKY